MERNAVQKYEEAKKKLYREWRELKKFGQTKSKGWLMDHAGQYAFSANILNVYEQCDFDDFAPGDLDWILQCENCLKVLWDQFLECDHSGENESLMELMCKEGQQ